MNISGHVKSIEYGGRGTKGADQTVTLSLEMARCGGQKLEVRMSTEEAKAYLPGTAIALTLGDAARLAKIETVLQEIYNKATSCDPTHYNVTMAEIIDLTLGYKR